MTSLHPDQKLKCLFINTKFADNSFWNYKKPAEVMGAKTPSCPLGLITVAALLPQHWDFKLVDLNAREMDPEIWDWAEMVLIGGMLPQQKSMIEYINKAKQAGKFVVVGGADPTSQPQIYAQADALVLGEGEVNIPQWLESWKNGKPSGTFYDDTKPDVTKTPIPRYDLLNPADYMHLSVQYSRGCPFNCEFCDIIELYGRKPRVKTAPQLMAELQAIYDLGFRGSVELVDDNFIGNKRHVKRELLPALIEWQRERKYPFFFSTEASMNLGDDLPLMEAMQKAEFRYVFLGIETPDPDVLLQTQKSQNTMGSIVDRVNRIYEHGMVVLAGFIMGFDAEKPGMDKPMIKLIEEANVCMAMVGLLVALPNTQLTRRLIKENRMTNLKGEAIDSSDYQGLQDTDEKISDFVDQTNAGLNFVTVRDRKEILREFANVIGTVYDQEIYADRCIRLAKLVNVKPRYIPRPKELFVQLKAFIRTARWFRKNGRFKLFWKTFFRAILLGPLKFEVAMRNLGMYMHFAGQAKMVIENVEGLISYAENTDESSKKSA